MRLPLCAIAFTAASSFPFFFFDCGDYIISTVLFFVGTAALYSAIEVMS